MPAGVHKTEQTAFRIPEGLLAWLRAQSEREHRPMTAIAIRALQRERLRCTALAQAAHDITCTGCEDCEGDELAARYGDDAGEMAGQLAEGPP